jgi:hypothetical protein
MSRLSSPLQHSSLKEIGVSSTSLAAPCVLLGKVMTEARKLAQPLLAKFLGLGGVCCSAGGSLRRQFAVSSGGLQISLGSGRGRYWDRAQRNSDLGGHVLLYSYDTDQRGSGRFVERRNRKGPDAD